MTMQNLYCLSAFSSDSHQIPFGDFFPLFSIGITSHISFWVCLNSRGEEGDWKFLRQDKCPDIEWKATMVQGLLSLSGMVDQERHFSNA